MKIALAALRTETPASDPETELVTVERHGNRLELRLDDGQVIDLDAWELIGAAAAATGEPELDELKAA